MSWNHQKQYVWRASTFGDVSLKSKRERKKNWFITMSNNNNNNTEQRNHLCQSDKDCVCVCALLKGRLKDFIFCYIRGQGMKTKCPAWLCERERDSSFIPRIQGSWVLLEISLIQKSTLRLLLDASIRTIVIRKISSMVYGLIHFCYQ